MTVVVAFHCSDGIVIAADSMITPTMGNVSVGHHHGQKIQILAGQQVSAFAGDQGQASRFNIMANGGFGPYGDGAGHPIDYPIALTTAVLSDFAMTRIIGNIGVNMILAFPHGESHQCCVFEGNLLQPRLLDADHYYVALGSGKLSADPFLRFLSDTFCQNTQPTVREAIFLSTWVIQHVIDTNPGGCADPIRVSILEKDTAGALSARNLSQDEIAEHKEAIESARQTLRGWRSEISGSTSGEASTPPPAPTGPFLLPQTSDITSEAQVNHPEDEPAENLGQLSQGL